MVAPVHIGKMVRKGLGHCKEKQSMKDLRHGLWQYSSPSSHITRSTCHVVLDTQRDSILYTRCSNCSIVDRAAAAGLQPRNDCTSAVGRGIQ